MKVGFKGVLVASAVAMMFAANCAHSDDTSTTSTSSGGTVKVKCVGGNDCKGKGACSGGGHDCQGQNSCKGKGWIESSSAKDCTSAGGKPEVLKN